MNEEVLKAINVLNYTLWQALKANDHQLVTSTCNALTILVKQIQ